MKSRLRLFLAAIAIVALSLIQHQQTAQRANASPSGDPLIAAAGDIACDQTKNAPTPDPDEGPGGCKQGTTATLLGTRRFAAILTLGDEQYDSGSLAQFMSSYDKTWGKYDNITRPAPGNHEYDTPHGAGYYAYYGSRAGDPHKGYYSYDLGKWHLIALNAECSDIGGCQKGSAEELWLKRDLAAHRANCTLAYWHQPRFSSGHHHSDPTYTAFWQDLYGAHADLVLNGHDHLYERFGPQTPTGAAARDGVTEIIAGTGGPVRPLPAAVPSSARRCNYSRYLTSGPPRTRSDRSTPDLLIGRPPASPARRTGAALLGLGSFQCGAGGLEAPQRAQGRQPECGRSKL